MAAKAKKVAKQAKAEKKSAKLTAKAAAPEVVAAEPAVDMEELEEQQEEAASATAQGGNSAAALAAASGTTEMSASFKNFRHHPDMENFYRFIFDNDLRHEALEIIDQMMAEKAQRKLIRQAKNHAH